MKLVLGAIVALWLAGGTGYIAAEDVRDEVGTVLEQHSVCMSAAQINNDVFAEHRCSETSRR